MCVWPLGIALLSAVWWIALVGTSAGTDLLLLLLLSPFTITRWAEPVKTDDPIMAKLRPLLAGVYVCVWGGGGRDSSLHAAVPSGTPACVVALCCVAQAHTGVVSA